MRDNTGFLKKGMAITFTRGEYSDRTTSYPYIVSKDFNYMVEAKKFWREHAEKLYKESNDLEYEWDYICDELDEPFIAYLIKNGFIETCEGDDVYIGGYEFFDADDWFNEFKKEKMKNE